ncbi:hypothetical protein PanWU01x14_217190 [Parasponia andersonii]|uniref:Uncharacterized protein n=1 Tax=Parasponia andersonii TaxID=3476 RepID=A0A2P5BRD7_PARAD|nr:hypothetical protein PanWU01x14_217190 [Parasponia andersonii]
MAVIMGVREIKEEGPKSLLKLSPFVTFATSSTSKLAIWAYMGRPTTRLHLSKSSQVFRLTTVLHEIFPHHFNLFIRILSLSVQKTLETLETDSAFSILRDCRDTREKVTETDCVFGVNQDQWNATPTFQ